MDILTISIVGPQKQRSEHFQGTKVVLCVSYGKLCGIMC